MREGEKSERIILSGSYQEMVSEVRFLFGERVGWGAERNQKTRKLEPHKQNHTVYKY